MGGSFLQGCQERTVILVIVTTTIVAPAKSPFALDVMTVPLCLLCRVDVLVVGSGGHS